MEWEPERVGRGGLEGGVGWGEPQHCWGGAQDSWFWLGLAIHF